MDNSPWKSFDFGLARVSVVVFKKPDPYPFRVDIANAQAMKGPKDGRREWVIYFFLTHLRIGVGVSKPPFIS